jgi:hypothetical protein
VHELNVRPTSHWSFTRLTTSDLLVVSLDALTGALKATGNRGLQPAMDHILEHEGQPVPDLGGVTESSSAGARDAMDVDDNEDAEALKSLGVAASGAVEAKVCSRVISKRVDNNDIHIVHIVTRASNVLSVVRSSKIPRWLISMPRRVAMINSRSLLKRSLMCLLS